MTREKQIRYMMVCLAAMGMVSGTIPLSFCHAESSPKEHHLDNYDLDEVIVEGKTAALPGGFAAKRSSLGILGDKNIMETPVTQYRFTEKALASFGNPLTSATSVLLNAPSVKEGSTITQNDFSIRGHYLQGASFYLNGIPGMYSQMAAPTHMISSVELISGPNMLNGTLMEKNAIAGTVNFISKKATETPVTRYTQVFSGRGNNAAYIDIGRRFGKNDTWGVRINGELQNGESSIKNANIKNKSLFINIDHTDRNSNSNLLVGFRRHKVPRGLRWFKVKDGVRHLPSVPNIANNVSFDQALLEENNDLLTLNHTQHLSQHIDWFTNIGMLNSDLLHIVHQRANVYHLLDTAGNYEFTIDNGRGPNSYRYYETGLKLNFSAGETKHDLVMSIDKIHQKVYGNSRVPRFGTQKFRGNIYTGTHIPRQNLPTLDKILSADTNIWGLSLLDYVSYEKWRFLIGGHKHTATVRNYNIAGKQTKRVDSDAFCPVYGFVYMPNEKLSLYADHSESFSKGEIVDNKYANRGEVIAPSKSRQNEIGVKWLHHGLLTTICYFDHKEAKTIEVEKNSRLYRVNDGEHEFKGVEASINGRVAPKWNVTGGFMYVNAVKNKTDKGTFDGYAVEGSSKWNAVLGLEYTPTSHTSIFGRMLYNGPALVNNEKLTVPGHTIFDLGVHHTCSIDKVPVTFTASCYNVFGKNYWMTRSGGGEVLLGLPRTWMLSMQLDL